MRKDVLLGEQPFGVECEADEAGKKKNPGIGLQEILVTLVQESANGDPAGHLGHCFYLFIYL